MFKESCFHRISLNDKRLIDRHSRKHVSEASILRIRWYALLTRAKALKYRVLLMESYHESKIDYLLSKESVIYLELPP